MTQQQAIVFGALIGAGLGFASTIVTGWISRKIAERKRADELLATALKFLGGGTQRRNLGIAAIKLLWRQFPDRSDLCVEMLIGTAIYLLCESKQKDKSHELLNLRKTIDLLESMHEGSSNLSAYDDLKTEIDKRLENFAQQPNRGLWVSEIELRTWKAWLNGVS